METQDTGQGSRVSSPLILAVPLSLTPELLRKHFNPLIGPGQPSLSDSDHNASSAFPVQNWRGKSGHAPCEATGLMTGHLSSPLISLPETCPGSP